MNELELVARLRKMSGRPRGGVVRGIGDDCAVFRPRAGEDLLLKTDQLIEGVHFPASMKPEAVGERALARALSDIAAGAEGGKCADYRFEAVPIGRRIAPQSIERACHQPVRQQDVDIRFIKGDEPERHLSEELDENPAEAEHDDRSKLRIDAQAQDPFDPGGLIRLDQESIERDVRPRPRHAFDDQVAGGCCIGRGHYREYDAAGIGLMGEGARHGLHRDGEAHRRGGIGGGGGRRDRPSGGGGDTDLAEQRL